MESSSDQTNLIARLCIEQWKLLDRFRKVLETLAEPEKARGASQIKYSQIQLETLAAEAGLSLVEFDGEAYGVGTPAQADNLDEFETEDGLVVERTLEPAVVRDMKVILTGRVLVRSQD